MSRICTMCLGHPVTSGTTLQLSNEPAEITPGLESTKLSDSDKKMHRSKIMKTAEENTRLPLQQQQNSVEQNNATALTVNNSSAPAVVKSKVNLLNYKGFFAEKINFAAARLPHQRLALFGGFQGIVSNMIADRTIPDLKTFTLLLETIAPEVEEEEALIQEMQRLKVRSLKRIMMWKYFVLRSIFRDSFTFNRNLYNFP